MIQNDTNNTFIIDFGIAVPDGMPPPEQESKTVRTLAFMSPEQVVNVDAIHTSSDMYAVGALLYQLFKPNHSTMVDAVTGGGTKTDYFEVLIHGTDVYKNIKNLVNNYFPGHLQIRRAFQDLLLGCFQMDLIKRITATDFLEEWTELVSKL